MKKYLLYLMAALSLALARICSFHWIVGSHSAFFSWTTVVAPVAAFYAGFTSLGILLMPVKTLSVYTFLYACLHRLPLLGSAVAYRQQSFWSWVLLPLMCMALFVVHPVGSQAWVYSLYWLIPPVLYVAGSWLLTRALAAVFVAHAIGSVIWLYCGTIPAHIWLSLIPVVAYERLTMTFGMITCELFVRCVYMCLKRWRTKTIQFEAV